MSIELNGLLTELNKYGKYEPIREDVRGYSIVISEINGVATLVLNFLLYRLNNLDVPVKVYLVDRGKVLKSDVGKGLFQEQDVGLGKNEYILKKYAGNFSNVILIDVRDVNYLEDNFVFNNESVIYLDFSKKGEKDKFENILLNQNLGRLRRNNAYIWHQETTRDEDIINMSLLSGNRLETEITGNRELYRLRNQDRLAKDNLVAVTISSVVNNLVTEGEDLTFKGLKVGLDSTTQDKILKEDVE